MQRKGWDLRAGTINTCHASHTYMSAHLSFHTRADRGTRTHASDRGVYIYVGKALARAERPTVHISKSDPPPVTM